jgi:hypothetical protein
MAVWRCARSEVFMAIKIQVVVDWAEMRKNHVLEKPVP